MGWFTVLKGKFGFEYDICRRCINDIHNTHLKPEHCLYDHYRYNCPRCGAYSHIVKKVTFAGHVRMFLHKRKTKRIEKNLVEE